MKTIDIPIQFNDGRADAILSIKIFPEDPRE